MHTLEEARAYIRGGALRSFADKGIGPYAIVVDDSGSREDGGAPVGVCGLFKRDYLDAPDLGYALLTHAQGHGYALEAAQAVVGHAKAVLGIPRLLAIVVCGTGEVVVVVVVVVLCGLCGVLEVETPWVVGVYGRWPVAVLGA